MSLGEVIRLKRWQTYLDDGRSSVTYDIFPKYGKGKTVGVFVMLGVEPVTLDERAIQCEDAILLMADKIKHVRAESAAKAKKRKPRKKK